MKTLTCILLVYLTFPTLAKCPNMTPQDSLIVSEFVNLDSLTTQQRREYLVREADKMVKRYAPGFYREIELPTVNRIVVGSKNDTISAAWMRTEEAGRAYYIVTYPHDSNYEYMHMGFAAQVSFWADNGVAFEIMDGDGYGYVDISKVEIYNDPKYVRPYQWTAPLKPRKEITIDYLHKLVDSLSSNQPENLNKKP